MMARRSLWLRRGERRAASLPSSRLRGEGVWSALQEEGNTEQTARVVGNGFRRVMEVEMTTYATVSQTFSGATLKTVSAWASDT